MMIDEQVQAGLGRRTTRVVVLLCTLLPSNSLTPSTPNSPLTGRGDTTTPHYHTKTTPHLYAEKHRLHGEKVVCI